MARDFPGRHDSGIVTEGILHKRVETLEVNQRLRQSLIEIGDRAGMRSLARILRQRRLLKIGGRRDQSLDEIGPQTLLDEIFLEGFRLLRESLGGSDVGCIGLWPGHVELIQFKHPRRLADHVQPVLERLSSIRAGDPTFLNVAMPRYLLARVVLQLRDGCANRCDGVAGRRSFREQAKIRLAKIENSFKHLLLVSFP